MLYPYKINIYNRLKGHHAILNFTGGRFHDINCTLWSLSSFFFFIIYIFYRSYLKEIDLVSETYLLAVADLRSVTFYLYH